MSEQRISCCILVVWATFEYLCNAEGTTLRGVPCESATSADIMEESEERKTYRSFCGDFKEQSSVAHGYARSTRSSLNGTRPNQKQYVHDELRGRDRIGISDGPHRCPYLAVVFDVCTLIGWASLGQNVPPPRPDTFVSFSSPHAQHMRLAYDIPVSIVLRVVTFGALSER